MTFFDWFMAILGLINVAALIFWVACELKPELRRNKIVNESYKFFIGYDDLYETE